MTKFSKVSSLLAFSLLVACQSESASLPTSKTLSPTKVEQIAKKVDSKYPNLAPAERADILALVIHSIDQMVFIEGGEFEMGDFGWACDFNPQDNCSWPCGMPEEQLCNISIEGDAPIHPVKLSSYYLASKKTTLHAFDLFRKSQGKPVFDSEQRNDPYFKDYFKPDVPAPTRYWQEAKDYCNWIGDLSGYPVDLPTEAQWEYAARNRGKHILYPTSNGNLNFGENYPPKHESGNFKVFPTGSFSPNPLGLYEMSAVATEWVNDWYSKDYYQKSPVLDPQGPSNGQTKVSRGSNAVETPWLSANTVLRRSMNLDLKRYSKLSSFRCAIQQSSTLE
ncbi:SUMF1/EgtB/PvdO family nonheme iron enzyme (plasmid) [Pseudomonas luteola]|uniref:formylglycine-generating enzyme family protein n=1 Tax=Pseudomonas luteola TaxID=47886 RepID=UPI003DA04A3F